MNDKIVTFFWVLFILIPIIFFGIFLKQALKKSKYFHTRLMTEGFLTEKQLLDCFGDCADNGRVSRVEAFHKICECKNGATFQIKIQ